MEGFEKGFSASKSTASPKRSITGSGENNENDSNQEQSNSNSKFHNHKKVVVKHFMSPTISAASKAAAPRKKILAERNENSSVSDDENKKRGSRNSGISHSDLSSSRVVSWYSRHESDEEGDINSVDDSSVKAYDPLTNYLSPRPKYLRFNPNKRIEILNRIEKEEKELNSSSDSQEVDVEEESSVENVKGIEKVEKSTEKEDGNMNNDYDEEEEEEELEEERGWCLRGLLKVILTLIACLLSTSYICSMNSPITSPTQQAISNLKDSYLMIKKQTIEGFTMKIREAGFFKMGEEDNYGEVEEIEIDEEDETGETEENIEEDIVEDEANLEEHDEELGGNEIERVRDGEIENIEEEIVEDEANLEGRDEELGGNENENDAEIEGVRDSEIESKLEKVEQLLGEKTDESGTFCLEKENEASYDDLNEDNIHKIEAEIAGGGEVEYETEQLDEKTDQSEEIIGSHEKSTDSGHEEIGNDAKGEIEKMGWNNNTSAIIGVSIVSTVLTSLAFIYRSKKTIRTIDKESRPVLKPHKFSVEEQVTPVLPKKKIEFSARPEELNRHIGALPEKKIEFSARPKEFNHHTGAPTVELIGEFVVGQMSSLRIGERKHEMNGSEERNASSFLKQAQPASTPAKLSEHEYSTTNSPSYGSFTTTEKKISKKEGGRSGEPVIDTPVRRSTRIRNRAAVTSP
ncbi:hypothetical protein BUALT_Bualt07G0151300 [Buddleja alternifolia]|uniref:Uncharacterized protein n=1 Tax=Buddleja alternifolia TaxID=168488 RepID=A0AAV6XHZ1_9LAMI|nr:hypothetical protein BUALT_Bualt07G0151300 [Buddleja alternifolia]